MNRYYIVIVIMVAILSYGCSNSRDRIAREFRAGCIAGFGNGLASKGIDLNIACDCLGKLVLSRFSDKEIDLWVESNSIFFNQYSSDMKKLNDIYRLKDKINRFTSEEYMLDEKNQQYVFTCIKENKGVKDVGKE